MQDNAMKTAPSMRVLRRPDVERLTGLARSTLYERMESGDFPRAVRLVGRSVGWIEAEVLEWIEVRMADRVRMA